MRFSKLWFGAIPLSVTVAVAFDPRLTSPDGNRVEPRLGGGGWQGSVSRGAGIGGGLPAEGFRDSGGASAAPPAWRSAIRAGRACAYP